MGVILEVRDWIADKLADVIIALGISTLYTDSEKLRDMTIYDSDFVVLHPDDVVINGTPGHGMAEYDSPYWIIRIVIKERASINVTGNTANIALLDEFVDEVTDTFEASLVPGNAYPFTGLPLLIGCGIGNESDPIGLPGSIEEQWNGKLILWAKFNFKYRRVFNCV